MLELKRMQAERDKGLAAGILLGIVFFILLLQAGCSPASMNTTSSSSGGAGGSGDVLGQTVTLETGVAIPSTKVGIEMASIYCINPQNVVVAYTLLTNNYFNQTVNKNYNFKEEISIDVSGNVTDMFWTNKGGWANDYLTYSKVTGKYTFDQKTRTVFKSGQSMLSQMTPWTYHQAMGTGTSTAATITAIDFSFDAFNGAIANETLPYIMFYWPSDTQHTYLNVGIGVKGMQTSRDSSATCYKVFSKGPNQ